MSDGNQRYDYSFSCMAMGGKRTLVIMQMLGPGWVPAIAIGIALDLLRRDIPGAPLGPPRRHPQGP
jgi:hypothetical protein